MRRVLERSADGDYAGFNGTSSAAPIVAGACALLLSEDPSLDEVAVRDAIRKGADKVGQFGCDGDRNDQMGHGRLNVFRSLNFIRGTMVPQASRPSA